MEVVKLKFRPPTQHHNVQTMQEITNVSPINAKTLKYKCTREHDSAAAGALQAVEITGADTYCLSVWIAALCLLLVVFTLYAYLIYAVTIVYCCVTIAL